MTNIEWTERTWNPVVGCSIVSPGCTNCYAMRMAYRLQRMAEAAYDRNGPDHFGDNQTTPTGPISHYHGTTKVVNGNVVWSGKLGLAPEKTLLAPLKRRKPTMWFVNSMSDLFHESVPDAWIDRVFAAMALTPQHTYQVLTKRSARMRAYCNDPRTPERIARVILDAVDWPVSGKDVLAPLGNRQREEDPSFVRWPLPNVWLGVSCESQKEDERIIDLLATPAAVRFVSAEPLLGPLYLSKFLACTGMPDCEVCEHSGRHIDWIIVGGESGPGARPMHPAWARSIRDQCTAAGVPFFFKQWGSWGVVYDRDKDDPDWRKCDLIANNTPNGQWLNIAGGQGFHGERVVRVIPMNKARPAGRLLDGREHSEWPSTAKRMEAA